MAEKNQQTGWWNPEPWRSTSKWHWVTVTGRTACGRYAYLRGDLEQGNDDSGDNCAACRKKRQKANRKVSVPASNNQQP